MSGVRTKASLLRASICAVLATIISTFSSPASAVSIQERAALIEIYNSAGGAGWTNNTNWNGAGGTECTWFGVTCSSPMGFVTEINLFNNNLVGTLPSSLSALKSLRFFSVGLNQLTGSLPSLTGLNSLETVFFTENQFTGTLPSLSGLTALQTFDVGGSGGNQITGSIPPLTGLTALANFNVNNNDLTGSIPSLAGLTSLDSFTTFNNRLGGEIPPLTGLSALGFFDVSSNRLEGPIPSLSGLVALRTFSVQRNRLTGSIPPLAGLSALEEFNANDNKLTGAIPSLAGLSALERFRVENNQLGGAIPAVPSPANALLPPESELCPNQLTVSVDAAWDTATGTTPWSTGCTAALPNQTLTFGAPPVLVPGGSGSVSVTVSPLPGSSFSIVYDTLTPEVCSSAGMTPLVTVLPNAPIGSVCIITADKPGDATANTAPRARQSIVISAPAAATSSAVPSLGVLGMLMLAAILLCAGVMTQRKSR
jgi:hypothetical protein